MVKNKKQMKLKNLILSLGILLSVLVVGCNPKPADTTEEAKTEGVKTN